MAAAVRTMKPPPAASFAWFTRWRSRARRRSRRLVFCVNRFSCVIGSKCCEKLAEGGGTGARARPAPVIEQVSVSSHPRLSRVGFRGNGECAGALFQLPSFFVVIPTERSDEQPLFISPSLRCSPRDKVLLATSNSPPATSSATHQQNRRRNKNRRGGHDDPENCVEYLLV